MKLKTFYSLIFHTLFLTLLTINFSACDKDDDSPNTKVEFGATLNEGQETPPTGVSATGTCEATYDTVTNILTYTLTWTGLTDVPTAMHFHKADIGVPGGVEIPITGFAASATGTLSSTATVEQEDENDLLEEKFYVNIHTALYPSGEIRGQMLQK